MTDTKLVTEATLEQRIKKLCDEFETRAEENIKIALLSCEKEHQRLLSNFKAHTRHIRQQLQGANEDHLSLHDDTLVNHEVRIQKLETI